MVIIEAETKQELQDKLVSLLIDIASGFSAKELMEDPVSLVLEYKVTKNGIDIWSNTLMLNIRDELTFGGVVNMIYKKVTAECSRFGDDL